MDSQRLLALAVLLGVTAGFSFAVMAAPKAGSRVTVVGCPKAGTIPTCVMLKGSDGTNYNVSSASPKPVADDVVIRLTGKVTDKYSICIQGYVLEEIKWTATKQKCPKS